MKWPWVSREAYEERGRTVAILTDEVDELLTELRSYGDGVMKLAMIVERIAGQSAPPPVNMLTRNVAEPQVLREPDPVAQVIREQAISDGREDLALAAHLRKYALQLKREGLSPDEIVGKLVAWQSTETEPAYDKVG